MSEMVERVAASLWAAGLIEDHDVRLAFAQAAIEAMREPTEAMINSPMARCYNDGPYADKEVRRIFSAMIDVALDRFNQITPNQAGS